MKDRFTLSFETMPKGTAQMKRYNGKTQTYFKSKTLMETEKIYRIQLMKHRPYIPAEGAVRLFICLQFRHTCFLIRILEKYTTVDIRQDRTNRRIEPVNALDSIRDIRQKRMRPLEPLRDLPAFL